MNISYILAILLILMLFIHFQHVFQRFLVKVHEVNREIELKFIGHANLLVGSRLGKCLQVLKII